MHKPKTKWQKRKEKVLEAWRIFKETKVGLIGIGILIIIALMALVSSFLP